MAERADSPKRRWIMAGWSSLCAVVITTLMVFSIYETRNAQSRVEPPRYAVEPTGERLLY
jgi:hypothetical protein